MSEDITIQESYSEMESPEELPAPLREKAWLLLVMAAVIVADHISQLWIESWLPLNGSWSFSLTTAPYFQITHVSNTGAAFGLFPSGSSLFMMVAVVVAAIIIIYNYRLPAGQLLFRTALGLQLGGALGNLIDRLRLGHVTDFLDFGPVPVFNLADASICIGVALLAYMMLREYRLEQEREETAASHVPAAPAEPPELAEDRGMLWNE